MSETDLVWFSALKSLLGIARRCHVKHLQFCPYSLGIMLEYIERVLLTRVFCCLTEVTVLHFQSQVLAAHFLVQRLRIHYSCGK